MQAQRAAYPPDLNRMTWTISEETGLWGLFAASFVAATLVPMSSEVVLFGFLKLHPQALVAAITVATLGNTLGGMTSYTIGRFFPQPRKLTQLARVRRYGAPILALAWLPIVGDALCVAAGWLRINWLGAMLFQAAGRLARYVVVAWFA
jgi:membrane protein YqaA with SNARE-associated domain